MGRDMTKLELMAPAGSYASLSAAIRAGAGTGWAPNGAGRAIIAPTIPSVEHYDT